MKWLLPPILLLFATTGIIIIRFFLVPLQILPPPFHWFGAVAIISGLAVTLAGSNQFQRVKTNINTFRDPDILVTSGVFSVSRNPMYLGFCMALFGAAIVGTNAGDLIAEVALAIEMGAKVMASLINQLALDKVTVWDAHSEVVPALLERVENVEQTTLISQCPALQQQLQCGALSLVSPDAGASKKTLKIAHYLLFYN